MFKERIGHLDPSSVETNFSGVHRTADRQLFYGLIRQPALYFIVAHGCAGFCDSVAAQGLAAQRKNASKGRRDGDVLWKVVNRGLYRSRSGDDNCAEGHFLRKADRRNRIRESRVDSTHVLALAMVAITCFPGCTDRSPVKGAPGAESVDELTKRYKEAHERKDTAALLALCIWRAPPSDRRVAVWAAQWAGPTLDEKAMETIFEFPLRDVQFEAGPIADPRIGGEVIYYIPGAGKNERVVGSIYGKLLLSGTKGETLDPSYVVVKDNDRYWIDVLTGVLTDASEALRERRKPKYVAAPMQPLPNALKGERARTFK
jgi:hypothetical protein